MPVFICGTNAESGRVSLSSGCVCCVSDLWTSLKAIRASWWSGTSRRSTAATRDLSVWVNGWPTTSQGQFPIMLMLMLMLLMLPHSRICVQKMSLKVKP